LAIIPFLLTSIWLEGAETVFSSLTAISGTTILVILYLGLAGTLLGYSLWGYLLSRYPAVEVAPLTLGVPVVGIICSAFFLNERLSVAQIIGILLVMLGLLVNVLGAKLWLSAATKSAK
jgi:drug/metabolite transporter (DMT)-like permease